MAELKGYLDGDEDFPTRIESLYQAGGLMAERLKGFRPRAGQRAFARAVAETLETHGTLIAEAGTGTGKTFAYLVPAIAAGVKTIVSTAGKSLQDQLFVKDLPAIRKLLGVPVVVSLLKGRANYLCLYRLELAQSESYLPERDSFSKLRRIALFSKTTSTGDKAELPDIAEDDPLWPMVTSTRENCLGRDRCPYWEQCFVKRARERALESDVVVVNHHLYLSSLALKNQSNNNIDGLLPEAALTVIDEAHQLPSIASDFFGSGFSTKQLEDIADEALMLGSRESLKGNAGWSDLRGKLQGACRTLRLAINKMGFAEGTRVSFDKIEDFEPLLEPFVALKDTCELYHELFIANEKREAELDTLYEWFKEVDFEVRQWCARIERKCGREQDAALTDQVPAVVQAAQAERAEMLAASELAVMPAVESEAHVELAPSQTEQEPAPDAGQSPSSTRTWNVLWFEVGRNFVRFNSTPLSFAQDFRKMREQMGGSWVFTSATLSNNADFTHFRRELGIDQATEYSWESPFNYWEQGCLYIPKIPAPQNNVVEHTKNVITAVWPLITAAEGRTFVLCTSLAAVAEAASLLEGLIEANHSPFKLLVQGQAPKGALINEFRSHGNAVLVGSMGFWEGVDVQGEALSLVVIDKIPFSPPDDPVSEARSAEVRSRGGNPFVQITLPEAVIALKQGAGRLIRSETDRGMVVLCDSRVTEKNYGAVVLKNLPDFYRTRRADKALSFFLTPEQFRAGLYE